MRATRFALILAAALLASPVIADTDTYRVAIVRNGTILQAQDLVLSADGQTQVSRVATGLNVTLTRPAANDNLKISISDSTLESLANHTDTLGNGIALPTRSVFRLTQYVKIRPGQSVSIASVPNSADRLNVTLTRLQAATTPTPPLADRSSGGAYRITLTKGDQRLTQSIVHTQVGVPVATDVARTVSYLKGRQTIRTSDGAVQTILVPGTVEEGLFTHLQALGVVGDRSVLVYQVDIHELTALRNVRSPDGQAFIQVPAVSAPILTETSLIMRVGQAQHLALSHGYAATIERLD